MQAFIADPAPNAYEKLVDRLMASPQLWRTLGPPLDGRRPLRRGQPDLEATNPGYPYAWRYRDWIVEAMNADMPYDRFIKLQLAADLMPGAGAQRYAGAGLCRRRADLSPRFAAVGGDVIGGFLTDDWDERIDAVSRGILGVSAGCARCHDHKFDPFTQKDYTALMGVFVCRPCGSSVPCLTVDPKGRAALYAVPAPALRHGLFGQPDRQRRIDLHQSGRKSRQSGKRRSRSLKAQATKELAAYPQLITSLENFWLPRQRGAPAPAGRGGRGAGSEEPYMNAAFEAAQFVDASRPHLHLH